MNDLIDVRCPNDRLTNTGRRVACNQLCVQVRAGSSGKAYCTRCKMVFKFDVTSNAK